MNLSFASDLGRRLQCLKGPSDGIEFIVLVRWHKPSRPGRRGRLPRWLGEHPWGFPPDLLGDGQFNGCLLHNQEHAIEYLVWLLSLDVPKLCEAEYVNMCRTIYLPFCNSPWCFCSGLGGIQPRRLRLAGSPAVLYPPCPREPTCIRPFCLLFW